MASYTFSQLEQLWINAGGSKRIAPTMAAIALAESGGNPTAHNASGASGLWQIMLPINSGDVPGGAGNVYNPQDNAAAAVRVFNSQGLGAWTTYTSGAYKQFLSSSGGGSGFLGTLEGALGSVGVPIGPTVSAIEGTNSAINTVGSAANTVGTGLSDASSALSSIASYVGWVFTPSNWLRMLKFIAGAIAIYIGLKALTGVQTPSVTTMALKAAK